MEDKLVCEVSATDKITLEEIREGLYSQDDIRDLSQIFKALGDPTRLNIVHVLSKSPLCVCDISDLLGMSQSAISHHLRLLRNLRLVRYRKEGRMVIYSLDDDHVLELFKQGMDHVKHD